jgi:thiol:disulfide interchange protein DsbD
MKAKRAFIMLGLLALASLPAVAKPWWMRGVESNEADFLPPDLAFRPTARLEGNTLRVRWLIADGYYLYKQRMAVVAESPDLVVTRLSLPPGTVKTDPYLGTQEIYTQQVDASVGFRRLDYGAHPLQIKVTYQGCAEAGLCYPPIAKILSPSAGGSAVRPPRTTAWHPWEGIAIGGGVGAFLVAGLLLRKGRTLPLPAA